MNPKRTLKDEFPTDGPHVERYFLVKVNHMIVQGGSKKDMNSQYRVKAVFKNTTMNSGQA